MPEPPRRPELRRYLGRFPGALPAVKDARDWLSRRLELAQTPGSPAQDALLILSELATNALLHSPAGARGGAFLVSVFVSAHCLRISVRGCDDTRVPTLQAVPAGPESEHGRGLLLVNALADTWGVERTPYGPAVFFTLEWGPGQPDQPMDAAWSVRLPQQRTAQSQTHQQSPTVPAPRTALRNQSGW
ncbi:ATP-binding protein [Nocardiopsis alborubida]|uniref:ATP-binding protein n=1 Tax=Nocardiopsis alborubida TaxID=146802 RepID=A0A7X6RRI6_9ACTN|nr:ATP-binding protein [Nocardiopsis alborubida]NKY99307.1 ATP-binding protein [Nocardiopsis alborubida]